MYQIYKCTTINIPNTNIQTHNYISIYLIYSTTASILVGPFHAGMPSEGSNKYIIQLTDKFIHKYVPSIQMYKYIQQQQQLAATEIFDCQKKKNQIYFFQNYTPEKVHQRSTPNVNIKHIYHSYQFSEVPPASHPFSKEEQGFLLESKWVVD